jgi:hypothetical protein
VHQLHATCLWQPQEYIAKAPKPKDRKSRPKPKEVASPVELESGASLDELRPNKVVPKRLVVDEAEVKAESPAKKVSQHCMLRRSYLLNLLKTQCVPCYLLCSHSQPLYCLYRFTERDGRKGPPAGNKASCNIAFI